MDDDSTGADEWKHAVSGSETQSVLHAFLADRDVPCPNCGYNLRGLVTTHCPECRQELVLCLRTAERNWTAFIWTVVGLSLGTLPALLMVAVVTFLVASDGGGISRDEFRNFVLYPAITGLILLVPLRLFCSAPVRLKFLQARPRTQIVAVLTAWFASGTQIGVWTIWTAM